MNLNDLAFVINYILTSVSDNQISGLYSTLITQINSSISTPSEENSIAISDTKDQIVNAHQNITPHGWSFARQNLFIQLKGEEMIAGGAAGSLLSAFSGFSTTPELLTKVQSASNNVQKFINEISALKANLGKAGEYVEDKNESKKILIEFVFDGDVQLKTITDLAKQSVIWEKVFSNYQRLVGEGVSEVEIAYINKINPVTEGLMVLPVLAQIFKLTVEPILDVRNKWLEGQILLEQLKGLKLDNMVKVDNGALDKMKDKVVNEITAKLLKEHKKSIPEGSTAEEVEGYIKNNTEEIYDFIVKGGRIDVASTADGDFKASFQLSDKYFKLKELEGNTSKFIGAPADKETKSEKQAEEATTKEEPV